MWHRTHLVLGAALSALALFSCGPVSEEPAAPAEVEFAPALHLRHNLLGYRPDDPKLGIAFGDLAPGDSFEVVRSEDGTVAFSGPVRTVGPGWGRFVHTVELDFTAVRESGTYFLRMQPGPVRSSDFRIGEDAFGEVQDDLLAFMRQQRCGYNPTLDMVCHKRDGRSMEGPLPDSTYVDVSGGWHDAGDQLKYLLTSSNATARLLLAYEMEPGKFADRVNELGQSFPNGVADVLDEARWGLDWVLKMHPEPDHLYHQVADDRDHRGWKWPDQDPSDYGWGSNSYRVAYFATGRPQGLGDFRSEATGVANLAGRSAAALAIGARIFRQGDLDLGYAARCLKAAVEVYTMGRAQEGFQQGNSFGAPYRYTERTWADDMEWAAAELFKATGDRTYLVDARRYARLAANDTWMPHDTTEHYQYYPFMNMGHFALFPVADKALQDTLAGYYRAGIEATVERGKRNAWGFGVPFIWCSNNLAAALITQILLYEHLTGDTQFHSHMIRHRDWLLGRNPWGTSMFTGIPRQGERPEDIHTSVWRMTGLDIPGGLVDGPVYRTIFSKQHALVLSEPDEFAHLQNPYVVYHDDIGDYTTNEPTMDGTADAVYLMARFGSAPLREKAP